MMDNNQDLEQALHSQPRGKGQAGRVFLGVIALLIIAAGYWLTEQFLLKGEVEIPLPGEVAAGINEALRLDDGKIGPVRITSGDPAGREAEPGSAAAAGAQAQAGAQSLAVEDERPSVSGIIVAQGQSAADLMDRQEPGEARPRIYSGSDAVVTLGFVNDLADYLAANYWPKGTHLAAKNDDASSVSLSSAGQRYGVELTGFTSTRPEGRRDYLRDRALVLHYVYTPAMVDALTRLYADRFADALADAGFRQVRGGAAMTREQTSGMLSFYARYARAAGAALSAYNATENAAEIVLRYTAAQKSAYLAGMSFHEAGYRVENARELQNAVELQSSLEAARAAEQEYRKAMLEQERAKEAVLAFMGKEVSRRLEEQELLYIAAWAARRGSGAGPAHQAASGAADYLAQALDEKAAELMEQDNY